MKYGASLESYVPLAVLYAATAAHRAVASVELIANGLPVPNPGGTVAVAPEVVMLAASSASISPIGAPFVRSRAGIPLAFAVVRSTFALLCNTVAIANSLSSHEVVGNTSAVEAITVGSTCQ